MTTALMGSPTTAVAWTKMPEGRADASATAAYVNYGFSANSQARVYASNEASPIKRAAPAAVTNILTSGNTNYIHLRLSESNTSNCFTHVE